MLRLSRGGAAAALVVTCVLATAFVPSRAHVARPRTHLVQIKAMRFEPASLTVAVGDTIVWRNADALSHTATSTPRKAAAKPTFDSREIKPGATVRWVVRGRGQLAYICSFHPVMSGVVVVK